MRITHLRILLCFAILYPCATALQAQSTSSTKVNPPLVSSMTLESFQQRVQALGFPATRGNTDGKPDNYFMFMAEGRRIGAIVITPTLIELWVSYSDGAKLEDLNEWNYTPVGTAASLDKKGDAILKSDLNLVGGVTEQNVNSFITRFRDAAGVYAHFIVDHKKS